MSATRIEILCGCGWGNLAFEVQPGDQPVCPVCDHVFPEVEEVDTNDLHDEPRHHEGFREGLSRRQRIEDAIASDVESHD